MTTIFVSNAVQLMNAIKVAKNGDDIKLNAGAYNNIVIVDTVKAGNITISSADADRPAVFNNMAVKNSSGITFSDIEMFSSKDSSFYVGNSSNIHFDDVYIHGTLNGSSFDDYRGIAIRDSSNISITNSRFAELTDALNHLDSSNVTIDNNDFSLIRDNGVAGGGTSHLTITNNYFTNFQNVDWVIHPDAIQVWTFNTKAPATDIRISGNVFARGAGTAIQGIWLRDETGSKPYERVTITDNTIMGASYQGIGIADVKSGLLVSGNTVVAQDDQHSWLRVINSDTGVVTNNIATGFVFEGSVHHSGNVQALAANDSTTRATVAWLGNNLETLGLSGSLARVMTSRIALLGFVDDPSQTTMKGRSFSEVVILGTEGADRLSIGKAGDYQLDGRSGNDILNGGGSGDNTLVGGSGNDILTGGGTGTNTMIGGTGDDIFNVRQVGDLVVELADGGTDTVVTRIDYALSDFIENARAELGGITIRGNSLNNALQAGALGTTLDGAGGDDLVQGGAGDDLLYGGIGNDRLTGNAGGDMLLAGDGNDTVYGSAGNDGLDGGSGNDMLEGGVGTDRMRGGAGSDVFQFRTGDFGTSATGGFDRILDFSRIEGDRISLSMVDANTTLAGDQAFQFIGGSAFGKVAGQVRVELIGSDSFVSGDVNGDGVADFTFIVTSNAPLAAIDFWL